jgi:hypothetical protein
MNPIVLIAELLAHGLDIEYSDGILYFIGDFNALPLSLQLELSDHQRDLTAWAANDPMGASDVL